MATVRLVVCGDEGTGKSSLITSLVKDVFVTSRIQPVLPPISLPPTIGTPANVTTWIVDTSAAPQERNTLRTEIRKCNVILLVYADHYSYERVALFWMPYFRSLGVNVPVVLCANKADGGGQLGSADVVQEEMLPVMAEFKEIDSCIRTSAREHFNINEAFYLCQKAVTHPIAPLYDPKELALKPAAVSALRRIFYLCDKDQDGLLNDAELLAFQLKCFEKPLGDEDLVNIKTTLGRWSSSSPRTGRASHDTKDGIDIDNFLLLHRLFAEKGRHETVWIILRKFNYTDSLTLHESFLHPKFDVPAHASAELSPAGYRFLVDLFVSHDKDNDGGLDDTELASAFAPTPGLPQAWVDASFPSCTVCNEAGHVTLQGWLAQWSMTTFEDPGVTLEYLAHLGFEPHGTGKTPYYAPQAVGVSTTSALKVTKPRKRRPGRGGSGALKTDRNVFFAYVVGGPGAGKTSLLNAFLNRPFNPIHAPTLSPRVAVNSVELESGKQCYLILSELGSMHSSPVLSNVAKTSAADLICYVYDGSDPDSFAHLVQIRARHAPQLETVPAVFAALKADADRVVQRAEVQPDAYTEALRLGCARPLHISAMWARSVQDFCVHLAECAADPGSALPAARAGKGGPSRGDGGGGSSWWGIGDGSGRVGVYMAVGAAICGVTAFVIVWRRGLD